MPILIVAAVLLGFLVLIALFAVSIPFSIFMRYRAGTARRRLRRWMAATNTISIGLSVVIFLVFSGLSNVWIPKAFAYSLLGMLFGMLLGVLGLASTKWEPSARGLFYTPNRWLVLLITLVVTVRIGFGLWRAWHAWQTTPEEESWLAASGLSGSMGVGAMVLGYYCSYWMGLWRKVRREPVR